MPLGGGWTMAVRPGPPKAPKSFCAPWAAKMTPTMTRPTSRATSTAGRSCDTVDPVPITAPHPRSPFGGCLASRSSAGADEAAARAGAVGAGPPRVEYRLTELGGILMPALEALSAWAEQYGPAVEDHRRRADAGRDGSEESTGT